MWVVASHVFLKNAGRAVDTRLVVEEKRGFSTHRSKDISMRIYTKHICQKYWKRIVRFYAGTDQEQFVLIGLA